MDDVEERPSKIRKLDISNPPEENVETGKAVELDLEETSPVEGPESEAVPSNDPLEGQQNLSKSALKKLRRKAAWAAGAEDRRLKRREKHKEKQARKATARQELESKIASGELPPPPPQPAKPYSRPAQVPVGLILDCGFEEYMTEKELISLGSQVTRCYSENRSARYRTHLCISEWGGRLKERFETVLDNNHTSWKGVLFEQGGFVEAGNVVNAALRGKAGGKVLGALQEDESVAVQEHKNDSAFPAPVLEQVSKDISTEGHSSIKNSVTTPAIVLQEATVAELDDLDANEDVKNNNHLDAQKNGSATSSDDTTPATSSIPPNLSSQPPQLVYLSSDSPHTLETLSPYTSYIIGGIVDKNRHKGICYRRAVALGIPTAKLPIGEYMVMQSRTVLAVNHVVEIMLRWLEEGDWGTAFERVIPKRKGGVLRGKEEEHENDPEENIQNGNEDLVEADDAVVEGKQ
jgi:tRNA (guanine9-N1)-methyltransferase